MPVCLSCSSLTIYVRMRFFERENFSLKPHPFTVENIFLKLLILKYYTNL